MKNELIVARIKGFAYELGALFLAGVVGFITDFLGSDVFKELVTKHFGETVIASVLFFIASGIIKHVRNIAVIGALNKKRNLGTADWEARPDLI